MELYILDETFKEVFLIQNYKSVIWTERFRSTGDCEIYALATSEHKDLLRVGTYLGVNLSPRIMMIDTVRNVISEDGENLLKITGVSIERIFTYRTARQYFNILDNDDSWLIENKKPADIMRFMVDTICRNGVLDAKDNIAYLKTWPTGVPTIYPKSDIPEPNSPVTAEIPVTNLMEALDDFVASYPVLGYRLYRRPGFPSELYFDVYTGADRTLMQGVNSPVVFSLPWGSLASFSELDSIADYANVAYVFSKYGKTKVGLTDAVGLNRRVLTIVVNDQISDNLRAVPLENYLKQKGLEALAEARRTAMIEGELPKEIPYTYLKDYNLGDYVDLLGEGGNGARMVVVENIFVSDSEGFRSYPTFEMDEHIDPDTWSGLRGGEVWSLMPGYWADY